MMTRFIFPRRLHQLALLLYYKVVGEVRKTISDQMIMKKLSFSKYRKQFSDGSNSANVDRLRYQFISFTISLEEKRQDGLRHLLF